MHHYSKYVAHSTRGQLNRQLNRSTEYNNSTVIFFYTIAGTTNIKECDHLYTTHFICESCYFVIPSGLPDRNNGNIPTMAKNCTDEYRFWPIVYHINVSILYEAYYGITAGL